jgi:hypothetical protein
VSTNDTDSNRNNRKMQAVTLINHRGDLTSVDKSPHDSGIRESRKGLKYEYSQ